MMDGTLRARRRKFDGNREAERWGAVRTSQFEMGMGPSLSEIDGK